MNWLIYLKTRDPFWTCFGPVWTELQACSGCGDKSENVCWFFFYVKMQFFFHVKVKFFFHVKVQFFFCHCKKTKHWRLCSFHALCHVLAQVSSGKLITQIQRLLPRLFSLSFKNMCTCFPTVSSRKSELQCDNFSVCTNNRTTSPTNILIQASHQPNGCRSRGSWSKPERQEKNRIVKNYNYQIWSYWRTSCVCVGDPHLHLIPYAESLVTTNSSCGLPINCIIKK